MKKSPTTQAKYARLMVCLLLSSIMAQAQNVGINTSTPEFTLDVRGTAIDEGALLQLSNADQSQRILLFGGREGDPNPFMQWTAGSPMRFVTDEGGFRELMRIQGNGNVGIGTISPDPSARLDIASTSSGMLVPRMTTEQREAIADPANGLLVYDITTNSFWFTKSNTWAEIGAGAQGWKITGNTNTTAAHFVGTADEQPLRFKVNNVLSGYVSPGISSSTSFGYESLASNTGDANVGVGYRALSNNTEGNNNTANGWFALYNNTTGERNTANGMSALFSNTIGDRNTANGEFALASNTTGYNNTANGVAALFSNTTGYYNTANGESALINNTTGYGNTANGFSALFKNTSGYNNTAIGRSADVTSGNLTNATAIGYNAKVNASNKIRLGNTDVMVIEGQVAYTFPSDGRFKTNISESEVKGLDFIIKLRPVVYNFDTRKFDAFARNGMPGAQQAAFTDKDYGPSASIRQSGFIAQEVEQAALEAGYNFNGIHKPENDRDHYSLAYSQFVVPLVKGMQEQQEMIEAQHKQVKEQQQQIAELQKQNEQLFSELSNIKALLEEGNR